jgi:sugar (pentulose or hexulose) kinase
LVRYPLVGTGERFPFISPAAQGFVLGQPGNAMARYAAGLEGAAHLERLAYEVVGEMGLVVGPKVYITGGGSSSGLWNRVRASVLGRQLARPIVTETAMGAAVLAAAGCWYDSLHTAVAHMVRMAETVDPDPAWTAVYEARYRAFKAELVRRGYLK